MEATTSEQLEIFVKEITAHTKFVDGVDLAVTYKNTVPKFISVSTINLSTPTIYQIITLAIHHLSFIAWTKNDLDILTIYYK